MLRYAIAVTGFVGLSWAQAQLVGALVSQGLFAKTYGGADMEAPSITAKPAIMTSDNGFALVGTTNSFGPGYLDMLALKLDANGNISWTKTFGGPNDNYQTYGASVVQATEGGYAVAGYTDAFSGNYDILLVKLDASGNFQWAKTYGGTNSDVAHCIIRTTDGGYAISGETWSYGAGTSDLFVLKLTSAGALSWARTFGGTNYDYGQSIIQTADGGYAITGETYIAAGDWDIRVVKLNASGNLSWARTIRGTGLDLSRSIVQTTDGGYAVAGYTTSFGAGAYDALILKLDASGNLSWTKTFGDANDDRAWAMIQTADGGLVTAGFGYCCAAGSWDFFILKMNSSGTLLWARSFGGLSGDAPRGIIHTTDGGFFIAGETASLGAGSTDFIVLRLDQNGNYPSSPGCVRDCTPTAGTASFTTSTPTGFGTLSPTTSDVTPTITTPTLSVIDDVCESLYVEEINFDPKSWITCSPLSGGVLFVSSGAMPIRIYSADGRVAYSGNLEKGQNTIPLDQGVYIWKAGTCKGKVAIR